MKSLWIPTRPIRHVDIAPLPGEPAVGDAIDPWPHWKLAEISRISITGIDIALAEQDLVTRKNELRDAAPHFGGEPRNRVASLERYTTH
jgi:hypothetical protein